jgi:hypothetical protein
MPKQYQNLVAVLGRDALKYLELTDSYDDSNPVKQENIDRFKPLAQTADETAAFDMMRAGFAPTPERINQDMSMLMDPYKDSVINTINREAGGEYSILKQAMGEYGQMGSNREILGANDIDLTRTNQIGTFMSDQFNTNLSHILNEIPALRQNDATNRMGIGAFNRDIDWKTKQAPIESLRTLAQMVSAIPANSSTSSQSSSSGLGGVLGGIGGMMSGAGALGGLFGGAAGLSSGASALATSVPFLAGLSDPREKENVEPRGQENGHNIYEFSYKDRPDRFIGVMADEVQKTDPDAVVEIDGRLHVDYSKIGVNFRRADAVV